MSDLVQEIEGRLLAQGKARIAGARLAAIVSEVLPAGQTFRDLLPEGFDRQATTFRTFVEHVLKGVVSITAERRGTDLLYNIIGSDVQVEPEPAELWRTFVSVKQRQQLVLDTSNYLIRTLPLDVQVMLPCAVLRPVMVTEHEQILLSYRDHLREQRVVLPQIDELLESYTEGSYSKLLKVLRSHTPPLDQSWGEFRKARILEIFESRLRDLGIDEDRLVAVLRQFAENAPLSAPSPAVLVEAMSGSSSIAETEEDRVRRQLHAVVDRMTLGQMNALMIPFCLLSAGER